MTKRRSSQSNDDNGVSSILREALAEYLGTTVLMVFGIGSVAQFVFSEGKTGTPDQVRWAWGLGVTFGVYVSGGVSGGHLNPAVTFTLCLFNRVPWKKFIPYMLGQYLGAFTASCLVFGVYYDAFNTFKDGNRTIETAGIFATYPQSYLSTVNGLGDQEGRMEAYVVMAINVALEHIKALRLRQIFGTAVLMLLVLALTDPGNMVPAKGILPVLVGLVVVAIGMTFSQNCGYAINPARDLAPRLFTLAAGWGSQVFSHNNYGYFWIPIVGPHIGAVIGGSIYELCINTTLPCGFHQCSLCPNVCKRRRKEDVFEFEQNPDATNFNVQGVPRIVSGQAIDDHGHLQSYE